MGFSDPSELPPPTTNKPLQHPPATLVVLYPWNLSEDFCFVLPFSSVILGRDNDCDVVLEDPSVSPHHARLTPAGQSYRIADLHSANGLHVRGNRAQSTELAHGDLIWVGRVVLRYFAAGSMEAHYHQRLRPGTQIDPVTAAFNRSYLQNYLHSETARSQRYRRSLSVLLVQVEGLAEVQRRLGGDAVDFALVELVLRCRRTLRAEDVLIRFCADQFLVVLPETDPQQAQSAAQRLQKLWNKTILRYQKRAFGLSLRMGVAGASAGEKFTGEALVGRACYALDQTQRSSELHFNEMSTTLPMEESSGLHS